MAEFKHRKGQDREVQEVTVRLYNKAGNEIYSRTMESGVIKDFRNYVRTVLDSMVIVDKYSDVGFGDMDMCTEVNGHLLNIEFKGNFEKLMKGGQLRQAVNLAETSKVTTIFVEGNPDNPQRLFSVSHVVSFNDYEIHRVNGIDGLNVYIDQWAKYVRKQKGVHGTDVNEKLAELKKALQLQLDGFLL